MKTHTLAAIASIGMVSMSQAVTTVVADFTFDDAASLAPFTQTGTPTVAGGELQLDGGSFLTIADPLGGAVDNYVVEAIVTATAFNVFDFAFARNDPAGANGGNNGQGLLFQDFGGGPGEINLLNSSSPPAAASNIQLALNTPTAIAIVQDDGLGLLFINGVQVATTANAIIGTPTNLGIGTHPFDGVAGAFNGSIDRVRLATFNLDEFDPTTDLLVVPEPSSAALLGLGGLALILRRRK